MTGVVDPSGRAADRRKANLVSWVTLSVGELHNGGGWRGGFIFVNSIRNRAGIRGMAIIEITGADFSWVRFEHH